MQRESSLQSGAGALEAPSWKDTGTYPKALGKASCRSLGVSEALRRPQLKGLVMGTSRVETGRPAYQDQDQIGGDTPSLPRAQEPQRGADGQVPVKLLGG